MRKDDSVIKVYDQIGDAYADKFSEPSDHLDEFLELVKGQKKILDVGCGPGVDSAYMTGKGFNVIGIDVSDKMLALARTKNPGILFEKADMRSLDFIPASFDGVLASFSLIHIPKLDMAKTLEGFSRVLNKDGVLYVGIQEGESGEMYVTEPLRPVKEKVFLNIMSVKELKELLNSAGFKVMKEYSKRAENKEEFNFKKYIAIVQKKN